MMTKTKHYTCGRWGRYPNFRITYKYMLEFCESFKNSTTYYAIGIESYPEALRRGLFIDGIQQGWCKNEECAHRRYRADLVRSFKDLLCDDKTLPLILTWLNNRSYKFNIQDAQNILDVIIKYAYEEYQVIEVRNEIIDKRNLTKNILFEKNVS